MAIDHTAEDGFRLAVMKSAEVAGAEPGGVAVTVTDDLAGGYGYFGFIYLKSEQEFRAFVEHVKSVGRSVGWEAD
jgi:hypothetical protein